MTEISMGYRKAITTDFEGILRLQQENLVSNLQARDISQGFLSIEFTREQIGAINDDLGIFVAVRDNEVLGYLMTQRVEFAVRSPLTACMMKGLKKVLFDDRPIVSYGLFVYGPVCIEGKTRGKGVLESLFSLMRESLKAECDLGIAFVSDRNPRSLRAHKDKLKMRSVDEFAFKGEKYKTLAFRVKRP